MQTITMQKWVCKDFKLKNLGKYHDLFVQTDTLLLADLFNNFWNMCLRLCKVDSAIFFLGLELAWQAALKKAKVNILENQSRSINRYCCFIKGRKRY